MNKAGRELAESTKQKECKQPDRRAAQARLAKKWLGLVASQRAITKEKVCRNHAIRLQDWEMWFTRNVTNLEKFKHGKHFFKFSDGDVAILVEVDDQIATITLEGILGGAAEKFEARLPLEQQNYADVQEPFWQECVEEDG